MKYVRNTVDWPVHFLRSSHPKDWPLFALTPRPIKVFKGVLAANFGDNVRRRIA